MSIPQSAKQNLIKYLGKDADSFLERAQELLAKYSYEWQLSSITYMPTGTVNLLFSCDTKEHGSCVLKLCIPGPEAALEINCLKAYEGSRFCKLWAYNCDDGIMLLEKITPGLQLWSERDFRKRALIFANLLANLHRTYPKQGIYPSYLSWLEGIKNRLCAMPSCEEFVVYLDLAIQEYIKIKQRYTRLCLLHGDLHQENLLQNSTGGYTIIDPKGVVDDPILETARFILNELPCESNQVLEIITIISSITAIEENDILRCLFIDTVLSNSWSMEECYPTLIAFEDAKQKSLTTCGFVHGILRNQNSYCTE
jgi:streptomycin 6-kinase